MTKEDSVVGEYFTSKEFDCRCEQEYCPARQLIPHSNLIRCLDQLRAVLGRPVVITSGIRCPEWNFRQGGKPDSAHLSGMAADLSCSGSDRRWQMLKVILEQDLFVRVGVGDMFIHVDVDPDKPQRVAWVY